MILHLDGNRHDTIADVLGIWKATSAPGSVGSSRESGVNGRAIRERSAHMDLDELKRAWQRSTTGNWTQASGSKTRMLAYVHARRGRNGYEAAVWTVGRRVGASSRNCGVAGSFIWQYRLAARFLAPAATLDARVIALMIACIRQIAAIAHVGLRCAGRRDPEAPRIAQGRAHSCDEAGTLLPGPTRLDSDVYRLAEGPVRCRRLRGVRIRLGLAADLLFGLLAPESEHGSQDALRAA